MKYFLKALRIAAVAFFWLAVWIVAAYLVDMPLLFPYPWEVLKRLFELMGTLTFYTVTLRSLCNVLIGTLIAIVGGCALSCLTARFSFCRQLFLAPMTIIKATPVASVIILLWLFIGSAFLPSFITVLIVLPVVWTNLDEGWRRIDKGLAEMTRVYGFSPSRRMLYLTLPSLKPYFVSACRTSIGLAWKAGIAAEIIVRPISSIGLHISDAKYSLESIDLFTWTLVVIFLSLAIELAFSFLFDKLGGAKPQKEERSI